MGLFDKKRMELLKKKVVLNIEKKHQNNEFSLFETSFFKKFEDKCDMYKKFEYIYNLVKDHDDKYHIPYEDGIKLEEFISDPNYNYGVHRTYMDLGSETFNDLLNQGIVSTGHANQGAISNSAPSLTLNYTPLDGLSGYINLLSSYKGNNMAIICAFPNTLVDEDLEFIRSTSSDDLYEHVGDSYIVPSSNIKGVLLFEDDNRYKLKSKEELLNERKI